jgi:RNA polymerase subunit RPABC4/transcription elongation factor Spt4
MPQEQILHPYVAILWNMVTIEFMIKFSIIYFFVVWIALIIWVARDITDRSPSLFFQTLCILIMIVFSPLGVFLYLLIRPGKSIYEKYSEEIEENLEILNEIVQDRLEHKVHGDVFCPACSEAVEGDFIICPYCHISLKHSCHHCNKEIRQGWKICPYCEAKQKESHEEKKTD